MPTPVAALLAKIDAAVQEDGPERAAYALSSHERSCTLSDSLWLTHRSGAESVPSILRERRLRAQPPQSHVERHVGASVYFFLGYPAYPGGPYCFLLRRDAASSDACFCPFDSGALEKPFVTHRDAGRAWELRDRLAHLDEWTGGAGELDEFVPRYVAAHFREPASYLAPGAAPDFPLAHGLVDPRGSRLAWTIEVRSPRDVELRLEALHLVVAAKDLLEELDSAWREVSHAADFARGADETERIATACATLQQRS